MSTLVVDPGEIREQAALLLEEKGWVQGRWTTDKGYCLEGALQHVGAAVPLGIYDSLMLRLEQELGDDLIAWNDEEGRTKEQVLAALRGTL